MTDILEMLGNYGVSTLIIALFIYDWINNKRDMYNTLEVIKSSSENMNNVLNELKTSNVNITKSLELLSHSMNNQEELMSKIYDKIL